MTVRAAGGIVWRDGEVLLVHRPKYDDWTFPKGKADDGETDEDAALREVEEETGFRCSLGPRARLDVLHRLPRPAQVRALLVDDARGRQSSSRQHEVDEIAWLAPRTRRSGA